MYEYFYKELDEAGIERPRKTLPENGFLRWGQNNRYWAIKFPLGDDVLFGDWQKPEYRGIASEKEESSLTPEERRQRQKQIEEIIKANEEEKRERQKEAAEHASSLWKIFPSISGNYDHPYLTRKKVKAYGLKLDDGNLVIPLYEASGKISSLQYIDGSGEKRFMPGGKKKGCYFLIGTPGEEIIICEGYATGASIHEATGKAVAVAFDCGNLEAVTVALKNKYPDKEIIIAADNDEKEGAPNRGVEEAQKVADKYSCKIVIPKLSKGGKADFNDIAVEEGLEKVASFFNKEEEEGNPVLKGESDGKITVRVTEGNKVQTEANNPENNGKIRARVEGVKEKQNALPFGYVLTDNSLLYTDGDKEPQAVASRIEVVALTRDDKSSNWGRLIRFKDLDSITKEKVLPNTIFAASDGRELFELLLSEGLRIYNKGALKRYLMDCSPSKRALCTDKTGWYKGFYVLPDEIITPKSNQKEIVIYQGNKTTTLYCRQGTLEDWKENVASYAVGNSRLTFGISLALACPLLDIVGMESGGFHLVGPSSCGKSTILKVASSVWGGKEFIKTWRTTDNGLEGTAASRTDNLLVLDEIGQADAAKALEMVYMLGNEEGKARADKNGMTKKAPSWRLLFLSSGEKDLQDCAIESKKKVHAGQNIRLLNIPAIKEGSRYGAFEDIHNIKDGAEFSSYLNKAIRETYGTAGRAFLKNLINEDRERIKEDFNHFLDEALSLLPEEANSQARRAYNHFILAAYAGEKASKEGIVPWLEGTALEAALICFNDWCEERGGLDNQEEKEILGQVKHFFEQNAESRFEDLTGANLKTIVNMVGYKNIEEGHLVFYVFTESFKRDICKGLNFKLAKEVLKEKGWLENKNSTTKRIKNELRRVYTFLSKIYE